MPVFQTCSKGIFSLREEALGTSLLGIHCPVGYFLQDKTLMYFSSSVLEILKDND